MSTHMHKAIFKAVLARAEAQEPRPGVKRNRCALDTVCGAAIALEVTGDVAGAHHLANVAVLVSLRGCSILQELRDSP